MRRRLKLILVYDGRAYLGWQKTRMGASIEQALESVVQQILQEPIQLQAASRTDAGVHAEYQVVDFSTLKENLDLPNFLYSVNSLLPKDIRVIGIDWAENNFHPTLDNTGKEYHYYVCYGPIQLPQHRNYSWHVPYELDVELMNQAAEELLGTHDFSALCNMHNNRDYSNHVRTLQKVTIIPIEKNRLRIEIKGEHFLYKMARNISGLLVFVGRHKIEVGKVKHILENKERKESGVTAPAHGLFLHRVFYSDRVVKF